MTDEYRRRIGSFLSNYIDIIADGYGYDDENVIKQGIKTLVKAGVFSAKELQKRALEESTVLIPLDFINKCVCG